MTTIQPFRAIRPNTQFASQVAAVPYDVINTKEASDLAAGNPNSFLRVTRSEIEMPETTDPYSDAVYQRAKENLRALLAREVLVQETESAVFVYQLQFRGHSQTGIAACSSIDEYESGKIKVHEKTRVDKETDRTRHILATDAHSEPVFLAYRDLPALTALLMAETAAAPLYDYAAPDGVRHILWKAVKSAEICRAFLDVPCTYIADGHHRAAAAARARAELKAANPAHTGREGYNFFLSVTFPHNQLRIMPYNRVIKKLSRDPGAVLAMLQEVYRVEKGAAPEPKRPGEISMYLGGLWYGMSPRENDRLPDDAVEALDVSTLYRKALQPIFGISDPRTDKNIDFVGGIRGTAELERLVNSGAAAAAFSLYPVSIEALLDIADLGRSMAPKSTWFEPKLRSGLFVHQFADD